MRTCEIVNLPEEVMLLLKVKGHAGPHLLRVGVGLLLIPLNRILVCPPPHFLCLRLDCWLSQSLGSELCVIAYPDANSATIQHLFE